MHRNEKIVISDWICKHLQMLKYNSRTLLFRIIHSLFESFIHTLNNLMRTKFFQSSPVFWDVSIKNNFCKTIKCKCIKISYLEDLPVKCQWKYIVSKLCTVMKVHQVYEKMKWSLAVKVCVLKGANVNRKEWKRKE